MSYQKILRKYLLLLLAVSFNIKYLIKVKSINSFKRTMRVVGQKSLSVFALQVLWSWSIITRVTATVADTNLDGRIVGGKDAAANSAPFIVSIQSGGVHYCAGSILNTNWIVTAAHCLTNRAQVLGSTLLAGSIYVAGTASSSQKRSITYYVKHDLYTGGTAPYDIGLIYTPTAFVWSAAVKAVTLPKTDAVPSGNANLFGWGSTSKTNVASYPSILQEARNIPIIPLSACELALGMKGRDVHDTNVCTGPLTGGVSICTSDSGGPLLQGNTLIGIVSWGKIPCGQAKSPSVFVQVSSFISWISSNQVVKT